METRASLPADRLCRRCDPDKFQFATTAELDDLTEAIGQTRAVEAVRFGIGMRHDGFNLYVLGPAGAGKHALLRQYLDGRAATEPQPPDWCYVNNFGDSHKPRVLKLPAARGTVLRADMQQLVEELRATIPALFESEEYHNRVEQIDAEFNERQAGAFEGLAQDAATQNIVLLHTPGGFSFAPSKNDEVVSPDEFDKLPDAEREKIAHDIEVLQERLEKIVRQVRQWRKERFAKIRELNREITLSAVGHLIDELKAHYADLPEVQAYFDAVQRDVVDSTDEFRKPHEMPAGLALAQGSEPPDFRRYQVNLLVDHAAPDGAPVVYEQHPSYQNLVGRVEHIAQFGTLLTDFSLIKPGALHQANGGYLMLDVYKLLSQPYAWEGLKRALSTRAIRIESLGQMFSLISTVSLEPEPIPLDVKVVLFGDRMLYYLLAEYDPEFSELFKVAADFEDEVERNDANDLLYARLIGTMGRKAELRPFERGGVARVIEQCARAIGDAEKLSTHMQGLSDLLREADYWAGEARRVHVTAEDVERAIEARIHRADRIRARVQEEIQRGTLMIDTDGGVIGQVNGLSVIQLGDYAFAHPTKITAATRVGDGEMIDIQREVELAGAIHSKGVLTLSSFLAARYASNRPLSLTASLVLEQTYAEVEGDSASVAELCALLSSLADLPLKQSLAVTGSVNQFGQMQAIGAVNEKIEGFFDVCNGRGLSGEQGVLIPAANIKHLMLRRDVVAAAAEGRFHIYPVENIDQAIEILTGVAAGEPDAKGMLPPDCVNYRVAARLIEFSLIRQSFAIGIPQKAGARRKPRKKQ
ncbi:MAG TPA: ATP-binding protein [Sulfuriferula sp.]|nr:ATP-binding protein [Sulfuriferula sp.]